MIYKRNKSENGFGLAVVNEKRNYEDKKKSLASNSVCRIGSVVQEEMCQCPHRKLPQSAHRLVGEHHFKRLQQWWH